MENTFVLLIITFALIICVCCVQKLQNNKENFNNIKSGAYFIKDEKKKISQVEEIPHRVLTTDQNKFN